MSVTVVITILPWYAFLKTITVPFFSDINTMGRIYNLFLLVVLNFGTDMAYCTVDIWLSGVGHSMVVNSRFLSSFDYNLNVFVAPYTPLYHYSLFLPFVYPYSQNMNSLLLLYESVKLLLNISTSVLLSS